MTNKIDENRSWNRSVTFAKRSAILIPVQQGKPLTKIVVHRELRGKIEPRQGAEEERWSGSGFNHSVNILFFRGNFSFHLTLRAPVRIYQVQMFPKVFNNYWMWVFEGVNWGLPY